MTDDKPLTKSDLVAALQEIGVATKEDLQKLESKLGERIQTEILGVERRLKRRMGKQKNEIMGAIAKLAETTPTITEFNKLKKKVDRYHPAS